jgi:hypothetical protein
MRLACFRTEQTGSKQVGIRPARSNLFEINPRRQLTPIDMGALDAAFMSGRAPGHSQVNSLETIVCRYGGVAPFLAAGYGALRR